MQAMRDLLRSALARSLDALTPADRVSAAWPVAAGHAIASRSAVVGVQGTVAYVEVRDPGWLGQLRSMTPKLVADLSQVSRVSLTDILFTLPDATAAPAPRPMPARRKPGSAAPPEKSEKR